MRTPAGIIITWSCFHSRLYPYLIGQPSSFRHVVMQDVAQHQSDYFFPALGRSTTNVNIDAVPSGRLLDEPRYLHSLGARSAIRTDSLWIGSRRLWLVRAAFQGPAGQWTLEQTSLLACGRSWQLTMSYDQSSRRELRPLMLAMLRSFRLTCSH